MSEAVLTVAHTSSGASKSISIPGLPQEDVDLPTASAILEALHQIASQDANINSDEFSYTLVVEGDEALKKEVDAAKEVCRDKSMATSAILHVPKNDVFEDEVDGPLELNAWNDYSDCNINSSDMVDGGLCNILRDQLWLFNSLKRRSIPRENLLNAHLYSLLESFHRTVCQGFFMGVNRLKMSCHGEELEDKAFRIIFPALIRLFNWIGWRKILHRFTKSGWKEVQEVLCPSMVISSVLPHPTNILAGSLVVSIVVAGAYTGFYYLVKYFKL